MRLLLILLLATFARAELTLTAIDGTQHALLAEKSAQPALCLFVSPFCSTTKALVKEINQISADYSGKLAIYIIESDSEITREVAMEHATLSEFKVPVLLDLDQKLMQQLKATLTPESVLVGTDGKTFYQGRINDLYLGPTKRQRAATTRDLSDAIDAILTGKPAPQPQEPAQGCKIGKK
jgi:hypothetical protein